MIVTGSAWQSCAVATTQTSPKEKPQRMPKKTWQDMDLTSLRNTSYSMISLHSRNYFLELSGASTSESSSLVNVVLGRERRKTDPWAENAAMN